MPLYSTSLRWMVSRVTTTSTVSRLPPLTTLKSTSVLGWPFILPEACSEVSSKTGMPSMAMMVSPGTRPALAMGEPG